MPSPYESLSVVVLEAWAMGRPVLVNAACRVLEGQCMRSGGGLFYRGYSEFADALRRLATDAPLRAALGAAGQAYVRAEYDWDVVERRTEGFLESLIRPCAACRRLTSSRSATTTTASWTRPVPAPASRPEGRHAGRGEDAEGERAGQQRPPAPGVAAAVRPQHDGEEQHGVGGGERGGGPAAGADGGGDLRPSRGDVVEA